MTTDEYLAFTATMLEEFDDAGFLDALLTILNKRRDRANPQIVFHPTVLARLAHLHQTDPLRFHGTFAPAMRRRSPDMHRDLLQILRRMPTNGTAPRTPQVVHMDQVEAQPLEWLWWPYIARGTVTMLDGDPGIGKSLLTLYLASIVSQGQPLPDQQGKPTLATGPPGVVLLLSAEDSVTHTIKQRLTASEADQTRIKVFNTYRDAHDEEQFLTLEAQNQVLLATVLAEYHPTLVILDPLQAFLGAMDMHRSNETRPFMRRLQHLAETYQTSIVCVRHPTKPGQTLGKAMHRGMGSVDFIGAARSGLFVEQHPTDKDKALLCQFKNNLAPLGRTQICSKQEGRFAWAGVTRLSAEQIAGSGRGPTPYAFLAACFWLEAQFAHTTMHASKDLEERAEEADITWRRVQEAKAALGVTSEKLAKGTWRWTLPPLPVLSPPPTCHSCHTCPTCHSCHTCHSSIDTTRCRQEYQEAQERQERQERQVRQVVYGEDSHPPKSDIYSGNPTSYGVPKAEISDPSRDKLQVEDEETPDNVPPPGRMTFARPARAEETPHE